MRKYSELILMPPTFPWKSIVLLVLLIIALIGCLILMARDSYRMIGEFRKCMCLSEMNGMILNLDELLTMSAKMAAVTGDSTWEDRYRNFEPKLNSVIKEAIIEGNKMQFPVALAKINGSNIQMVSIENQAFNLVHEGKGKEALALLSSPEYDSYKNLYRNGIEKFTERLEDYVNQIDDEFYFKNSMLILFAVLAIPAFIMALIVIWLMIKRYESELKKCENRFRDFSEISNYWIWELDCKMRFTFTNQRIKDILGYVPEEIIGKTPAELMTTSMAVDFTPFVNDLMDNPKSFHRTERMILNKDGTARTISVNGIPLYDHNDIFNGYRGICNRID